MKYAFILMGSYDSKKDRASFNDGKTYFFGVSSLEEAVELAKKLVFEEGVSAIEVCGAFQEEGAKTILEAVDGRVPVGYVVNFPFQEELIKKVYG